MTKNTRLDNRLKRDNVVPLWNLLVLYSPSKEKLTQRVLAIDSKTAITPMEHEERSKIQTKLAHQEALIENILEGFDLQTSEERQYTRQHILNSYKDADYHKQAKAFRAELNKRRPGQFEEQDIGKRLRSHFQQSAHHISSDNRPETLAKAAALWQKVETACQTVFMSTALIIPPIALIPYLAEHSRVLSAGIGIFYFSTAALMLCAQTKSESARDKLRQRIETNIEQSQLARRASHFRQAPASNILHLTHP